MELKNGIKTFYAKSQKAWRQWLQKNHAKEVSVWLIMYRKATGIPSVYYSEAVDEALCFGWIDSKPNKRDDQSFYQFFSKRNPKSNWSKVNKEKIKRLTDAGLMAEAGLQTVALAKKSGTWTALDTIEALQIPEDLQQKLHKNKKALACWEAFSPSAKKGMLQWIASAKTAATREKRIYETVQLAKENKRANQYNPK